MTGWLKLHNDIIHDPKIRALAFEDRWHFVALLCLKNDGTLDESDALRNTLVEVALGLHGKDLQSLKDRLTKLRLIQDDWTPANWDKRQGSKDSTGAERQRKYREKLKKQKEARDNTGNVVIGDSGNASRNGNVTGRSKKKEERSNCPDDGFDLFWETYRKKLKKDDARRAWSKLTEAERKAAMADISTRVHNDQDWVKQRRQFQPYAATYLRGRMWEDEWESTEQDDWGEVM